MQEIIIKIIVFIIVFGIIVSIHEYGHLFFAKRSGILVREYAIGMGPKIFAHRGKDGTLYTIRIVPVGGYVRLAGWGEDSTEIKKGQSAMLSVDAANDMLFQDASEMNNNSRFRPEFPQKENTDPIENQRPFEKEIIRRISLSEEAKLENAIPIQITNYDFEEALYVEGEVSGILKRFSVDHDATIIEEDGTELRIAPRDVQYQSASVLGKIITNFGGPLNNFILGFVAFVLLVFLQGGVPSNAPIVGQVPKNYPAYQEGIKEGDRILSINGKSISTFEEAVINIQNSDGKSVRLEISRDGQKEEVGIQPVEKEGSYRIGINQSIKTGVGDKILGGFTQTLNAMTLIFRALGHLFTHPSLNQLGGPVAIFQATGQAAQAGIVGVVGFLALLSINLGIVNLIPIPALDGGKILLNLIELIRRKPLPEEKEAVVTMVGVVFMIVLMIAVTWNDIMRAFIR